MGKNDVYATLEMVGAFEIHEEFSQRTTTVRNGGQAPRWAEGGETFVFDTLEVPSTLEVEVFDEDVGSADDKIGRVSVTLEDKLIKPTFGGDDHAWSYQEREWFELRDEKDRASGFVELGLHWAARDLTKGKGDNYAEMLAAKGGAARRGRLREKEGREGRRVGGSRGGPASLPLRGGDGGGGRGCPGASGGGSGG